MSILSHEHLYIGHNREAVLLVNQRVCGSLENDVWDQSGLFICSWMLSDGHSDSEMVVWKVWAYSFVSKNHIKANDSILWVFGALKEHIDINVLDQIELLLRGHDVIILVFLFLFWGCGLAFSTSFGLRISLCRGSLRLGVVFLTSSCTLWLLTSGRGIIFEPLLS